MKYKLFILLLMLIVLSSCSPHKMSADYANEYVSDSGNDIIVEETSNYKITTSNSLYKYYIYDKDHNIVKFEDSLNKKPKIVTLNNYLLRFTLQSGTGVGTQWGYYYDINRNIFSQIFHSIYDESDRIVAYGSTKAVIIQDIFDKNKYYYEINIFKEPLSNVAEPIISAEFLDDGKNIKISYYSGDAFLETTQFFTLPNNKIVD